jgi:hypothetical protein
LPSRPENPALNCKPLHPGSTTMEITLYRTSDAEEHSDARWRI